LKWHKSINRHTRMVHAQPTTFGHYLLSVHEPIERILGHFESGFRLLGLCELGCGALAGTSWPIERILVGKYLGLEGLVENSKERSCSAVFCKWSQTAMGVWHQRRRQECSQTAAYTVQRRAKLLLKTWRN
jgi:argininosuccinate lyase